jgi:hypothetical protein
MIIPVKNPENCRIYVEHPRLQARRYRFDLTKGESPRKFIILLRVGESSKSGHYIFLHYDKLPLEFEEYRQTTASNDDLIASELSVSNLLIYSL